MTGGQPAQPTADVSGVLDFGGRSGRGDAATVASAMPGETVQVTVALGKPVALDAGQTFAIRSRTLSLALITGVPLDTSITICRRRRLGPGAVGSTWAEIGDRNGTVRPAMNTAPRVTCVCPTFNRPPAHQWLVEEAIESFLRQDYPHRELIVLNDCPGQVLRFDHPTVVVINVGRRFRTLGEKINAAVGLSRGKLIAPWDDDDISLPWRLSRSIEILGHADYYNPSRYWFIDRKGLHGEHAMGLAHGCSMFTRRAFDLVGGYPYTSGTQDFEMDRRLRAHPQVAVAERPELGRPDWYYIYRWGVSPAHLSSRKPHEPWFEEIGRHPVTEGTFNLRPHWRDDYPSRIRRATARHSAAAKPQP